MDDFLSKMSVTVLESLSEQPREDMEELADHLSFANEDAAKLVWLIHQSDDEAIGQALKLDDVLTEVVRSLNDEQIKPLVAALNRHWSAEMQYINKLPLPVAAQSVQTPAPAREKLLRALLLSQPYSNVADGVIKGLQSNPDVDLELIDEDGDVVTVTSSVTVPTLSGRISQGLWKVRVKGDITDNPLLNAALVKSTAKPTPGVLGWVGLPEGDVDEDEEEDDYDDDEEEDEDEEEDAYDDDEEEDEEICY